MFKASFFSLCFLIAGTTMNASHHHATAKKSIENHHIKQLDTHYRRSGYRKPSQLQPHMRWLPSSAPVIKLTPEGILVTTTILLFANMAIVDAAGHNPCHLSCHMQCYQGKCEKQCQFECNYNF